MDPKPEHQVSWVSMPREFACRSPSSSYFFLNCYASQLAKMTFVIFHLFGSHCVAKLSWLNACSMLMCLIQPFRMSLWSFQMI